MRVRKIEGYPCPTCDQLYNDMDEASCCCVPVPDWVVRWECPQCTAVYDTEEEAQECCQED